MNDVELARHVVRDNQVLASWRADTRVAEHQLVCRCWNTDQLHTTEVGDSARDGSRRSALAQVRVGWRTLKCDSDIARVNVGGEVAVLVIELDLWLRLKQFTSLGAVKRNVKRR